MGFRSRGVRSLRKPTLLTLELDMGVSVDVSLVSGEGEGLLGSVEVVEEEPRREVGLRTPGTVVGTYSELE